MSRALYFGVAVFIVVLGVIAPGYSQEVRVSNGTLKKIEAPDSTFGLKIRRPTSAVLTQGREDFEVHVKLNDTGEYLISGTPEGRVTLWRIQNENGNISIQDPSNIGLNENGTEPFFSPGVTRVDLHPNAPFGGYFMASGEERDRAAQGQIATSRFILLCQEHDGKDQEEKRSFQKFGPSGGPEHAQDLIGGSQNVLAISPDGRYEAFLEPKKVVVTDKHGSANFGQPRDPAFLQRGSDFRDIGWLGNMFVVLDSKWINGFEKLEDPSNNKLYEVAKLSRSSRGAKGLACEYPYLLSYGEQGNLVRVFSVSTKNCCEIPIENDLVVSKSRIARPGQAVKESYSPEIFVTGFTNGQFSLWDITNGEILKSGKLTGGSICSIDLLQVDKENFLMAIGTVGGHLVVFNIEKIAKN